MRAVLDAIAAYANNAHALGWTALAITPLPVAVIVHSLTRRPTP
jgi:hypothetical protein